MLKTSHLKIATYTYNAIAENTQWKIKKTFYLIGSIAPDINCVLPKHTFKGTLKRFRKRLSKYEDSRSIIIRSFLLGVITHYICDYFCYVHNRKTDIFHPIYERAMRDHLEKHNNLFNDFGPVIETEWKNIISKMENMQSIDKIIEAVNQMHKKYMKETENLNIKEGEKWYNSNSKIELDIEYAAFLSKQIALIL